MRAEVVFKEQVEKGLSMLLRQVVLAPHGFQPVVVFLASDVRIPGLVQ